MLYVWWSWRCGVVGSSQATEVIPPVRQGLYTTLHCHFVRQSLTLWTGDNDHCPCAVIHENEVNDCSHCPCAVMHENWVSGSVGHGWLHKNNDLCSCLTKWQWRVVYKPCLAGESPQLLVSSPPLHISNSTKTFCNLSCFVTEKKATSNCYQNMAIYVKGTKSQAQPLTSPK